MLWAGLCLLVLLGLQLHLTLTRTLSWDEFHFLRQVHEFTRGELTLPLQTFHVQLFAWLPGLDAQFGVPGVDQIIYGRMVMLACLLVTTGSIYAIARRFVAPGPALLSALAYLSVGYVVQHATSFRTDPLAAALSMSALAVLARARWNWLAITLFGALAGTAFMVTIKIVLLAPAFAGVAWLRWSQAGFAIGQAIRIAFAPLAAMVFAAALFLWHANSLPLPEQAADTIGRSGTAMFGLSHNLHFVARMALVSLPFAALFIVTLLLLVRGHTIVTDERIALALLIAPLSCLIFYTNTYPYFYAFILPPVCVALSVAIKVVSSKIRPQFIAVLFVINALWVWSNDGDSQLETQGAIQAGVNAMFPEPVAYFDFPGFLPRHTKANFFMSAWGVREYRAAGEPHFVQAMEAQAVPLLLAVGHAGNPTLLETMEGGEGAKLLVPQDAQALHDTYRHVWGPAYVAGVELEAGTSRVWNLRVPGPYTVEGEMIVNGERHQHGAVIEFERGKIALQAGPSGSAGLLWGDHLPVPQLPAPQRPYWRGF